MRGVNKVIIVGNLGNDPDVKRFDNGGMVTNISVATSEKWNDKQTGEPREATEWHRIVFNNKLAEIAAQYLRKGSQVYVEGSLRTRKYQDQNGQDRYITEIRADQMQMLGSRPMGQGGDNVYNSNHEPFGNYNPSYQGQGGYNHNQQGMNNQGYNNPQSYQPQGYQNQGYTNQQGGNQFNNQGNPFQNHQPNNPTNNAQGNGFGNLQIQQQPQQASPSGLPQNSPDNTANTTNAGNVPPASAVDDDIPF